MQEEYSDPFSGRLALSCTAAITRPYMGLEETPLDCIGYETPLPSLQILPFSLMVDQVERRLGVEPARAMTSNSPVGISRLLLGDDDGLLATRSGGGFGHELRMAAFFEGEEPEDGLHKSSATHFQRRDTRLTSSTVCPTVSKP